MALSFNELLGQPFAPAVQRELEQRRSLNQRYETSTTLHNPYFKLRRINKMSNDSDLDQEVEPLDIKFGELNKLSKQGLNDIKEKIDSGGNAKPPLGITDVSIDVKDYTFHTLEVNFIIPDIADWEAFKETWLVFGAPVQYEFGRHSLVNIEDNEDITPSKEIREGLIANFSWNLGEQKRTITGSLTIYSATYVELTKMAHSAKYDGKDIASIFSEMLPRLQKRESSFENIKQFYGEKGESPTRLTNIDRNNNLDQEFLSKSKLFYSVISNREFKERYVTLEDLDQGESLSAGIQLFRSEDEATFENLIPFGTEIINKDKQDILLNTEQEENPQPNPDDHGLESQEYINYINSQGTFILPSGQTSSNFRDWFETQRNINNVPENIEVSSGEPLPSGFYSYGQAYLDWSNDSYDLKNVLNDEFNNMANTSIQKYALSQLNLNKSYKSEFESDVYFYVSLRYIGDILNWIIKYNHDVLDDSPLAGISLLDIKIRDLSYLGLGSSEPDKVLINPWNRKYSRNENYNPIGNNAQNVETIGSRNLKQLKEEGKEYILDPSGEYTLLEDVFISAEKVMEIARSSDSPLEFIEAIVDEIESATRGLLRLQKKERVVANNDRYNGKAITYFDTSTIRDLANDEQEYHKFNLFDHREKIRNIDVNSDLSDDFSQYAYFKSLGKISNTEDIFYHKDQFYNSDGSRIQGTPNTLNIYELTQEEKQRIKNKYGIGKITSTYELIINNMNEEENISPYRRNQSRDGFEDMVVQYIRNGREIMTSYQGLFNNLLRKNRKRLEDNLKTRDFENFESDLTIPLLTYIEAYFTVITEIYQLIYDPFLKDDGTTTIPLKVDISLDGIAGIVTGQVFKIDLSSFPMAYNISNTTPLFVVSTLNHSITENNDWETTIGGFLYIPASAQQDAVYDSSTVKELIDSKNVRLQMVGDIFKTKINNILRSNNE